MADPNAPATPPRDPLVRPLLWRLPLVAVVAIGLACLAFLDGLLRREFRAGATTQAVQTDALLESFVRQRAGLLHGLEVLVATVPQARGGRFAELAAEIFSDTRDVRTIAFVDADGIVRAVYRNRGVTEQVVGADEMTDPARAEAVVRARDTRSAAVAASVRLRDGRLGIVIYDPVVERGRVTGYVAGSFAYGSLFTDALAGQLQGEFAYRVSDGEGRVIAVSPAFPAEVAELTSREVRVSGAAPWRLDVAIPPHEPVTARLILWVVGLLLLLLVIFVVVREEQRAERLATHSFHLELLSRDLLDANIRLEERAQQVAEANRAKSRFLANVSHELRTPLNAIVGYNGLALDGVYGELPAELDAAHRRIAKAAEHLLGLVNDVLDLAKIEVGRMRPELEPVDVRALVDGVVTVIEPIASAKGVHVDIVLARDLPRLTSDPRHLRQILLNLLSNAVKFTERGTVTVVARRDERAPTQRVTLSVEDTGIGIAPGDLARIFDEFEQVRPSGRGDSQERGTGLGLAIARKLARVLGGDVTVDSQMGRGSRFTVVLPIVAPTDTDDAAGDGALRERERTGPVPDVARSLSADAASDVGATAEDAGAPVSRP